MIRGKVGSDLTLEQGRHAARMTGLGAAGVDAGRARLARPRRAARQAVRAWSTCAPGFDRTPEVIDGCSDLFVDIFGDAGRHARSAVGLAELPGGIAVEIEVIARIRDASGLPTPRRGSMPSTRQQAGVDQEVLHVRAGDRRQDLEPRGSSGAIRQLGRRASSPAPRAMSERPLASPPTVASSPSRGSSPRMQRGRTATAPSKARGGRRPRRCSTVQSSSASPATSRTSLPVGRTTPASCSS